MFKTMCGIIGYIGKRQAANVLLNGLKRLEYRGYDSCGIATAGSDIVVKKDVGRVEDVSERLGFLNSTGKIGIGHTRWSTHGKVTKENAHPLLSNDGKIAVVHNGIIENYIELKSFLESEGFKFYGETDSEIIPNLIQFNMKKNKLNFFDATRAALRQLEGSYAVVTLHGDEGKLIAARKESPLVVGVG